MLPRSSRLPSAEFHSGRYRTVTTPYFSLRTKENHGGKDRIGVVVSAAVNAGAVKRNFLKRQAKAVLLSIPRAPHSNKDLFVVFSPKAKTLTKMELRKKLHEAAVRAGSRDDQPQK